MANLVEVEVGGKPIVFAVAGSSDEGPQAYTAVGTIARAEETLDEALDAVRALGQAVSSKLRGLSYSTAEASFGIKVTGKGKFIVAEASAEASITVKLSFEASKNV